MHSNVHSTTHNSQDMEATDERIKKMWYICCSNMDGPRDYHTK